MSRSSKQMNHTLPIAVIALTVIGVSVTLIIRSSGNTGSAEADIVSKTAIHWHPELAIFIKGQKQDIPKDVGIGPQYQKSQWYNAAMGMSDVHTHTDLPKLHWEIGQGPVTKDQVKLGVFFDIWDKPFNSTQIFDQTTGQNGTVRMTVNGKLNTEYENYLVKDQDKIEIRFE